MFLLSNYNANRRTIGLGCAARPLNPPIMAQCIGVTAGFTGGTVGSELLAVFSWAGYQRDSVGDLQLIMERFGCSRLRRWLRS